MHLTLEIIIKDYDDDDDDDDDDIDYYGLACGALGPGVFMIQICPLKEIQNIIIPDRYGVLPDLAPKTRNTTFFLRSSLMIDYGLLVIGYGLLMPIISLWTFSHHFRYLSFARSRCTGVYFLTRHCRQTDPILLNSLRLAYA